jgi:hypothetical protein
MPTDLSADEARLKAYLEQHQALFAWPAFLAIRTLLPVPNAGIGSDGDRVLFTWDTPVHHYEIEVAADGVVEYYYLNWVTDEDGEPAPETVRALFT